MIKRSDVDIQIRKLTGFNVKTLITQKDYTDK